MPDTMDFLQTILQTCVQGNVIKYKQTSDFDCIKGAVDAAVKSQWPEETKLVFWTVLFLSMFASFTFDETEKLVKDSNNCLFTMMDGTVLTSEGELPTRIFLKFVPASKSRAYMDDPVFDSIHGIFLNNVARVNKDLKPYLPIFLDSFMTDVKMNKNTDWVWPISKILNMNPNDTPYQVSYQYKVSASFAIEGKTIGQLLDDSDNFHDVIDTIGSMYPPFFEALVTLGLDYGFVHNDLHLGNVFYNTKKSALVLIDFGKSHVGSMNYQFDKVLLRELSKFGEHAEGGYHGFCHQNHKYLKSLYKVGKDRIMYPTGITDVMTLTMQVLIMMRLTKDHRGVLQQMNNMLGVRANSSLQIGQVYFTIPTKTKNIYKEFCRAYDNATNEFTKKLIEGALYFALYVYYTQIYLRRHHETEVRGLYNLLLKKISIQDKRFWVGMDHLTLPQYSYMYDNFTFSNKDTPVQGFIEWMMNDLQEEKKMGLFNKMSFKKLVASRTSFLGKLVQVWEPQQGGKNKVILRGGVQDDEDIQDDIKFYETEQSNTKNTTTNIKKANTVPMVEDIVIYPIDRTPQDNRNASVESMANVQPIKSNVLSVLLGKKNT